MSEISSFGGKQELNLKEINPSLLKEVLKLIENLLKEN